MFKLFKTEIRNKHNKRIKNDKSESGGEYYGRYDSSGEQRWMPTSKYLEEYGVVPQYTMPVSPIWMVWLKDETKLLRMW